MVFISIPSRVATIGYNQILCTHNRIPWSRWKTLRTTYCDENCIAASSTLTGDQSNSVNVAIFGWARGLTLKSPFLWKEQKLPSKMYIFKLRRFIFQHAKWHEILSNRLNKVHECDRRQADRRQTTLQRNRQLRIHLLCTILRQVWPTPFYIRDYFCLLTIFSHSKKNNGAT